MQTQARSLCAPYDLAGALSLVAVQTVWEEFPGNITNPAEVFAGTHAPDYRARPTYGRPADFANNATAAVIAVNKRDLDKHYAYTTALSTLNLALLASVGADNKTLLKGLFLPAPLYSLTPMQIVEAMLLEYGETTGIDLQRLRAPLQEPLTSLAELERHMNKFMLASKKLTATGRGKNPYEYFETFLETVRGFPVVAQTLSTFYAAHPAIAQHTIATLFPHLKAQHTYMMSQSTASPFSGAATPAPAPTSNKKNNKKGRNTRRAQRPTWGPQGTMHTLAYPPNFSGGIVGPPVVPTTVAALQAQYQSEIQRLHALLATTTSTNTVPLQYGATTGDYGDYSALFSRPAVETSRPRPFFCWLHGWNISHNSPDCRVMASNPQYTAVMRTATDPEGNGGNPHVGPPVRLPFRLPLPSPHVLTCLPCLRPEEQEDKTVAAHPNDDTVQAGLATCAHAIRGAKRPSRTRRGRPTVIALPLPAVSALPLSVTWSQPLVTAIPPSSPPTRHPTALASFSSRFAHPNPFVSLLPDSSDSDEDDESPPHPKPHIIRDLIPLPNPRDALDLPLTCPRPFSVLSSVAISSPASPLIADSGCTGVLIQMSNFPSLSPFFRPKTLPQVPYTLPDGSTLPVGGPGHITGELSFPRKRLPVPVYFLPNSSLSHTLFGVSPLIRPEGRAVFTNTSCQFFDAPQSPFPFLTGSKSAQADLWYLTVPPAPLPPPAVLFSLQELPCARFVAYWHRAFGSPSLSTFLDALSSNFIQHIPRLTAALVRKYPPLSLATSFGHLDTLRQGIASTRKSPPSSALASSDNRRQAFLNDYDDQTSDSDYHSDSDSVLASPSLLRRSSRLAATPASDYCYSHTTHHSEWAASDLTGRFPVPSYLGHEYILITLHRGFIHYHPMMSRTAPAYVSAFIAVLSFFSSHGFPITNLKLDNESSSQLSALFVKHDVAFQHVPPFNHRTNPAERAIRTAKNHFLATLATTHFSFPPNRWNTLLPLAQLTLNHLRSFALDPSKSAWHTASMAAPLISPPTPSTLQDNS